jgi:hypothetical protein
MANRITKFWLPWTAAVLWPALALANAGTPLMWARGIHLFVGNLAIGIGEGLLLAVLFKKRAAPCIGIMIVANYFSAWIGGFLLTTNLSDWLGLDLNTAWRWLWIMVVAAYFLTVLLEWPFVAFCLRGSSGWRAKTVWGSLVVQAASYVVIFGWYWAASGTSLYREVAIVPAAEIHVPKGTVLYFIANDDGDVYALDLSQKEPRKVHELGSRSWFDRLQATASDTDSGQWDLIARLVTDQKEPTLKTVLHNFATVVPTPTERSGYEEWANSGEVSRLGTAGESGWKFRAGFWAFEGLSGENAKDGRRLHLSLETPFLEWYVRNATQLPGDQVVFQLGRDQICILDPVAKKIALVARGWGPIVALRGKAE